MSLNDTILCHSVEFVCPWCGHEIRIARCSVDVDADVLVHIYRRDILLGRMRCPSCRAIVFDPAAVARVNRSRDDEARALARIDEDIDPAALMAWIEEEQRRTWAEAEEVTEVHLRKLFDEVGPDLQGGRRHSELVGRYIALANVAGRVRAGDFDRGRS